MSLYRFARGAAIGAVGFISGYYTSDGMRKKTFMVHAVRPLGSVQPSYVRTISNEEESLTVEEYEISGDTSEERDFSKFSSMYDRLRKTPNYVLELLSMNNRREVGREIPKRTNKFREDMKIYRIFRSTVGDYKNNRFDKNGKVKTTFDKGHLASVGNYPNDEKAREETFILSNIVPQNRSCNRKVWEKLEEYIRCDLLPKNQYVTVCSGSLYVAREVDIDALRENSKGPVLKILFDDEYEMVKNNVSGKRKFMIHQMMGDVSVPTHFFKVIICENETSDPVMEGYMVKNAPPLKRVDLSEYKVPLDEIERHSGYLFTTGHVKEKVEEMKENLQNETPIRSFEDETPIR